MYIPYKLADGSVVLVELKPDVAEFILRNDREMANADRKERDHVKYHLEALEYEGMEYADPVTCCQGLFSTPSVAGPLV